MTSEQFDSLKEGDIVRGKASGCAFVIVQTLRDSYVAVRSHEVTHPDDWDLVEKEEDNVG